MLSAKKLLLEASESEEKFVDILKKHHTPDDQFDVTEVLQALNKRELDVFWENLRSQVTSTVLSFGQDEKQLDADCKLLRDIVLVAKEMIAQEDTYIPESLVQIAVILHGILLVLPDELDAVKNSISRLFELWWKKGLACHQQLVPHTLTYLLIRAEHPNATKADVKRVYQMGEALCQLDLSAESSADIRKYIQTAFRSLLYLKSDVGRKFLSYALNQSPSFTDLLHNTVKQYLPWAPKSVMPFYGEIYFRAWRYATGPNLEKLETGCIQDFMYHSILGQPEVASRTRNILSYIHQHKIQNGVDHMLVTLYEPILWRHTKVANGNVRLQAVLVLLDAFPLTSPQWHMQERDQLLQKQIDILKEMLFDPLPAVRAAVASGICSICEKYWELVPGEVIKDLIGSVVNDLAYDSSSPDVRAAVFRGLSQLINNPLTHLLLKSTLPGLASSVHDTSEKVRIAFIELLLNLKGIKAIKFWDIVPYEHLLARLEIDTTPVAKRLVKLLLDSHLSPDNTVHEHLLRCISLIENNRAAARRFYQYVGRYTTLGTIGRLMAAIFMSLESGLHHVNSSQCVEPSNVSDVEPDILETFAENNKSPAGRNLSPSIGEQDLLENVDVVAGLLEVVAIIWMSLHQELNKPASQELRRKLEKQACLVLPGLFHHFKDPIIITALIKLAGFLQPEHLPAIRQSVFTKLKQITEDTSEEEYAPILEVLCLWGKGDHILKLVSDWLMSGLKVETPRSKCRRSRDVSVADCEEASRPSLAIKLMNYMIKHKQCRDILLTDPYKSDLRELTIRVSIVKSCVEKYLQSSSPTASAKCPDSVLAHAFELYLKLEVLLHDKRRKNNAVSVLEDILSWAEVKILALLKNKKTMKKGRRLLTQNDMTLSTEATPGHSTDSTSDYDTMAMGMTLLGVTGNETLSDTLIAQKRSAGVAQLGSLKAFAVDIIQRLLMVSADVFLVGFGDKNLASHLADFSVLLLQIDDESSLHFLPPVCHLMYQIAGGLMNIELTSDEMLQSQDHIISLMLNHVIEVIITMATNRIQRMEKIFPLLINFLSGVLSVYYYHHSLNNTLQNDVMTTIVGAVITSMSTAIEEDGDFEPREKIDELPKLTTFLIDLVWKQSALINFFLSELQHYLEADTLTNMSSVGGVCHLLYAITKAKSRLSELKPCVVALEKQLNNEHLLPGQDVDDSPSRHLYKMCRGLVDKCKLQIGML